MVPYESFYGTINFDLILRILYVKRHLFMNKFTLFFKKNPFVVYTTNENSQRLDLPFNSYPLIKKETHYS